MSESLRARILLIIDEMSQEHPHRYVEDHAIAAALDLEDIGALRVQMDILAEQGYTFPANSMDGYAALLSPQGHLLLERIREPTGDDRPRVGF